MFVYYGILRVTLLNKIPEFVNYVIFYSNLFFKY